MRRTSSAWAGGSARRAAWVALLLAGSVPGTAAAQGALRPGSGADPQQARTARGIEPPAAGICADCGTVRSIERRERPRWSSIVGTAASYGVVPQRIGPSSAPGSRRAGDPAPDEDTPSVPRGAASNGPSGARGQTGAAEPTGRRDASAGRGSLSDPDGAARREADDDPDSAAIGRAPPAAAHAPDDLSEPRRRRALPGADDPPRRLAWQVVVRMDDGTTQTAYLDVPPGLQVGDRVRMGASSARSR